MTEASLTLALGDAEPPRTHRVQLVTLGSAPTVQIVRSARLILSNLSAAAVSIVFVNLGTFSIPVCIPAAATPIVNFTIEVCNGMAPVEITDFSIPNLPVGFAGMITLLLTEW